MKKLVVIVLVLILILGAIVFGVYSWYKRQINISGSDADSIVEVEIEKGESVKDIAVKLQTAGVIKSSDIFFIYIKINKIAPKIQAGKFKIPQNLTVVEVAGIIQKAAGNDIWVTIPEGLRMDEIADMLDEYFLREENTTFDKQEFLDIVENPDSYNLEGDILDSKAEGVSLEGYLYPNTYNVRKDITSIELINFLVNSLELALAEESLDIESYDSLDAYEVVILASIIEREGRTSEERYVISDVLQKRLRGEMDGVKLLQADATLLYEEKDWEAVVTKELKEKDTPYNTYKYVGLPPTPICNPGIDSIRAVLNPTSSEYFFYLHGEDGKIHYAVTNEEHINNQRCYINKNEDYCL